MMISAMGANMSIINIINLNLGDTSETFRRLQVRRSLSAALKSE